MLAPVAVFADVSPGKGNARPGSCEVVLAPDPKRILADVQLLLIESHKSDERITKLMFSKLK